MILCDFLNNFIFIHKLEAQENCGVGTEIFDLHFEETDENNKVEKFIFV